MCRISRLRQKNCNIEATEEPSTRKKGADNDVRENEMAAVLNPRIGHPGKTPSKGLVQLQAGGFHCWEKSTRRQRGPGGK